MDKQSLLASPAESWSVPPVSGFYRAGCKSVLAGQLLELEVAVTCLSAHILVSLLSLWELTVTLFLVLRDMSLLQPRVLTSGQGPWDKLRFAHLKVSTSVPSQPTYHKVVAPGPLLVRPVGLHTSSFFYVFGTCLSCCIFSYLSC